MENYLRLRFNPSTQHNFPWKISRDSIMQCNRVCIVINQFTLINGDILTQVLFVKLWMKMPIGFNLFLHFSPPGVSRKGRKDVC